MENKYNPDVHHRRSIRLKHYDYTQAGAYFVTVCTWQKECLFGDVVDGEMRLNGYGRMVTDWWNGIPAHFPHTELDVFTVMPNHMHGIIVICPDNCRGGVAPPVSNEVAPPVSNEVAPPVSNAAPQGGETPPLRKRTLGHIVAYFKYQSTKQINTIRNSPGIPLWQRNYYEHVLRAEDELHRIREYIINNPLQWADDENNPAN